jgi:L-fucose isomerase-like protein
MMSKLSNTPEVKLAIVGVSRDCFPVELTRNRLNRLMAACAKAGLPAQACPTIVESEVHALQGLEEARQAGANAAVLFLGNFGPEGPEAIFAQRFPGPVMACAAAEESGRDLIGGRGDAFCGLLNASYNFDLRGLSVHIPERPVGLPERLASEIARFGNIARVILGLRDLKVFGFGPRPQDFYACNAPLRQLYDLGIEVMENSELDLLQAYQDMDPGDPKVAAIAREMAEELGKGKYYEDLLPKLARFELTLLRFAERNLGSRRYAVFADKCWPAFERAFGFVPCYVNSRMATRGVPVSCEVDIYGAVSEYVAQLASVSPVTLLDINNTVPEDLIAPGTDLRGATHEDLFMGFHCGNSPSCCMKDCSMKFQLIMNRLMEDPSRKPDITRGTLEGQLRPGPATFFRLQGHSNGQLASYVAPGEILDVDPKSFGGIGVFAIPHFARFYRHVLVGEHFPHHGAVAFSHCASTLFDAMRLLGVPRVHVPRPPAQLYPQENPFSR